MEEDIKRKKLKSVAQRSILDVKEQYFLISYIIEDHFKILRFRVLFKSGAYNSIFKLA